MWVLLPRFAFMRVPLRDDVLMEREMPYARKVKTTSVYNQGLSRLTPYA